MKTILTYSATMTALLLCGCQSSEVVDTATAPVTVASTSLCGDGYVQVFAPEKISALSWQSRSKISIATAEQKKLPQIDASPERVFSQTESLILFGPGEGLAITPVIPHSLSLKWAEDFEGVSDNARNLLSALGLPSDKVDVWETRLNALAENTPPQARPKILYLTPSGGSAGPETFVDAVIKAAGGLNINPVSGWHSPDVETLIHYNPDIILMSFTGTDYHSRSEFITPVIQRYLTNRKVVTLPGGYWPCAGPYLLEAAEDLQTEIQIWSQPQTDKAQAHNAPDV